MSSWWPWKSATAAPVPDELESMDKLTASLQMLKLRRLEKTQEIEAATAKCKQDAKAAYDRGQKDRANTLLKRAKGLQAPLQQLDGQIANLEHIIDSMTATATSAQMASAMKTGVTTMQHMVKSINVDDAHAIRDDMEEIVHDTNELNDILARPLVEELVDSEEDDEQIAQWEMQREAEAMERLHAVTASKGNNNGSGGSGETIRQQEAPLKSGTNIVGTK